MLVHDLFGRCSPAGAAARRAAEGPEENRHPGQAELVAERVDRRRDASEILDDERRSPSSFATASNSSRPGSGRQRPGSAVLFFAGTHQYETKPRKCRPADIDELERPQEPLAPPAEAGRPVRPASRRAGPPTAGRLRSARRAARPHSPCSKSSASRRRRRRSRKRRSAGRRSAARRARRRTRHAPTAARSAPGRRSRPRRRSAPRSVQYGWRREVLDLGRGDARGQLREERRRGGERRR